MSWLRDAFDARYRAERGITGTDPRISDGEIVSFAARKAVHRMRGILRRLPHSYVGPRVQLHHRRRLTVGRGTSIAAEVVIDALAVDGVHLDDAATIDRRAIIRGSGSIRRLGAGVRIGRRSAVGVDCFIHGGGGVTIGDNVLLGPAVRIFSENHVFADPDVPIIEQGEVPSAVVIGDDVWIGASATILAGAHIGDGCVVAAGAVVRGEIPAYSIVAGVPARVVGRRTDASPRPADVHQAASA